MGISGAQVEHERRPDGARRMRSRFIEADRSDDRGAGGAVRSASFRSGRREESQNDAVVEVLSSVRWLQAVYRVCALAGPCSGRIRANEGHLVVVGRLGAFQC